jgi:hypothetical protein
MNRDSDERSWVTRHTRRILIGWLVLMFVLAIVGRLID